MIKTTLIIIAIITVVILFALYKIGSCLESYEEYLKSKESEIEVNK